MKYDVIVDGYISSLEAERRIIEEGVFAPVLLTAILSFMGYKTWEKGGIDPGWKKLADDSIWYNIFSIFDPTGVMSWPYVPLSWERYERDSSWLNGFLFILACLSTIPGVGIGAKMVGKAVASPILMPISVLRIMQKLIRGTGSKLNRRPEVVNRAIPEILAKASKVTHNGKPLDASLRKALEQTFGIKVTDDAIVSAQKRLNIKPAARASQIFKTGLGATKGAGKFARTGTAGTVAAPGLADLFKKKPRQTTGRVGSTMGPKVQFGTIGGGIE
jgi:hypothetical protein